MISLQQYVGEFVQTDLENTTVKRLPYWGLLHVIKSDEGTACAVSTHAKKMCGDYAPAHEGWA